MNRVPGIFRQIEDIASAFSQMLVLSQQERTMLEAPERKRQGLDGYLKLHWQRLDILKRIEHREKRLQGLTGLQSSPYQYEADVFEAESQYREYSGQIEVIRIMINEILANDLVIEKHLKMMQNDTSEQINRLEGNRKAAQAYITPGPPPSAWFIDRKK